MYCTKTAVICSEFLMNKSRRRGKLPMLEDVQGRHTLSHEGKVGFITTPEQSFKKFID
jgi:hypothetical protein